MTKLAFLPDMVHVFAKTWICNIYNVIILQSVSLQLLNVFGGQIYDDTTFLFIFVPVKVSNERNFKSPCKILCEITEVNV
jgi:hypothetical protein